MSTTAAFDVVVIGSGPGGYVAAIRCAQLGMKTAIIERYATLGGTCLNVGCIPSKALLDSSEHFHNALHTFEAHGIKVAPKLDWDTMRGRKDKVVDENVNGIKFLMKKNKIEVFHGFGSFADANTVVVALNDGGEARLSGKHIIIATGSKPSTVPGVTIDKDRVISSTEALQIPKVPKELLVIGGGYIGLEMGSVYARLGSKVTVIEYMDRLIPGMDQDLGKEIQKILSKKLGFEFLFKHKVTGAATKGNKAEVTVEDPSGEIKTLMGDYVLVAVGRRPYTDKLGLDKVGIQLDERGRIAVNEHKQTSVPHIYAIGDVIIGPMLAHKASEDGVFVAETIAGQHPHIDYHKVPGVMYTWPEVAGVGYTEQQLKENGTPYKVGKFPYLALGRGRAAMETDGFVKILAHKETDEILGFHVIGARAADMIAEGVVSLEFRASAEDLGIISHAHPTFSEAVKEAALAATGARSLHM